MRSLVLCTLTAAWTTACDKPEPKAPPEIERAREKDVAEPAKTLEKTLNTCKPDELRRTVDFDTLIEIAVAPLKLRSSERRGVMSGARQAVAQLAARTCEEIAGQHVELLRVRTANDTTTAIYRLYDESEGSFNYLEFLFGKRSGRIRPYDIHNYAGGDRASAILTRVLEPLVDSVRNNSADETLAELQVWTSAIRAGDFEAQERAYKRLPQNMRQSKAVLLQRLGVASTAGTDADYETTLADYEKHFPNDPGLHLLAVYRAFTHKKFEEAASHIDAIEKLVGGDPYLSVQRGWLSYFQGDYAEAIKGVAGFRTSHATWQEGHLVAVLAHIAQGDHDKAVAGVRSYEKASGNTFDATSLSDEGMPGVQDFVASAAWRRHTAGK